MNRIIHCSLSIVLPPGNHWVFDKDIISQQTSGGKRRLRPYNERTTVPHKCKGEVTTKGESSWYSVPSPCPQQSVGARRGHGTFSLPEPNCQVQLRRCGLSSVPAYLELLCYASHHMNWPSPSHPARKPPVFMPSCCAHSCRLPLHFHSSCSWFLRFKAQAAANCYVGCAHCIVFSDM